MTVSCVVLQLCRKKMITTPKKNVYRDSKSVKEIRVF